MRKYTNGSAAIGRVLCFLALAMLPLAAHAAQINEIRTDQQSTDNDEYFELVGMPGESLTGLTYIVIGDGTGGCGVIEAVVSLTGLVIQPDGYLVVSELTSSFVEDATASLNFENTDNVTHMLVSGFTGANGDDLDTNNDGVLDTTPWTAIVDAVGLVRTLVIDCVTDEYLYAATQIGPDGSFVPGHVFRCGAGFLIGNFTFPTQDTPGAANSCSQPPEVDTVYHRPLWVTPAEVVTVTANATDPNGTVSAARIFYRVNAGGFLQVNMALSTGSTYTGTIPGQALGAAVDYYVEAQDNDNLTGRSPFDAPTTLYSYTVQNEVITSIASIQANPATFDGTLVIVQGQVYCPGNYQADGTSVSAYVQDGSGRGINIFGTALSTGFADLNSTGNIVKVTGTVDLFGTTVELMRYEVELVTSGNPALSPAVQASTAAAAAPSNEGTFIQASGVITAIQTTGGSNPAHNFTVDDCSGAVVVRVDDSVDPAVATHAIGDGITAAGAGATFSGQGQILVCSVTHFTNNGAVGDVCPPGLVDARSNGASQVTVVFDEAIDATTGGTEANYTVFETATPGNTTAIVTATVSVPNNEVVLTLAASLSINIAHTLRVNNVRDVNGNAIAPNSEIAIVKPTIEITEIMQNPVVLGDGSGEWFEIHNESANPVDINGWTIRDNDTDVHVIANGGPLVIPAGAYRVLGANADSMASQGVTLAYQYSGIVLGNAADEVVLVDAMSQEVDRVEYDGGAAWPDPVGASMQWDGNGDNNDGENWSGYGGAPVFGGGDRGTPGAVNDVVSSALPGALLSTRLLGNRPNPFNPITTIQFTLERQEHVSLIVFDIRGRKVRALVGGVLEPGLYDRIVWDGKNDSGQPVQSGTYVYQLETASGVRESRKMTVLR